MRIGVFAVLSIVAVGCASDRVLRDSDGNSYTVKVMSDGRTWTTTNLRLALPGSYCHGDVASECLRLGRLYTWASAAQACTRLGTGWRLPTDDEWRQLAKAYGGLLSDSEGYWLGNVSLVANLRYKYTDSRQSLDHRAEQRENFFILHPDGSAQLTYAAGVTPETRLEDLPDSTTVATVTFDGQGGPAMAYRIVAYRTWMSLALEGEAMSFRLRRGWVNYWR